MALSIPCSQSIQDCVCTDDPISNYSSENPDEPVFFGHFNTPPVTGTFFAPGCLAICESTVSQAAADECAQLQAEQCSIDSTPTAGNPVPPNRSTMQFTTASPLDSACIDDIIVVAFNVIGGTSPYTFAQVSGDLPDGTALDPDGTLAGTVTAGGTFTFAVRATDVNGRTVTKSFSMSVIEITSPSKLPDGERGSPYEYTLLSTGASSPVWTVDVDELPPGLSLSATGVISGTPTTPGYYPFTVTLSDSTTECSKVFTIEFDPLEYWKLDEASGNRVGSVNGIDLVPFGAVGSSTGIIGNAWRWTSTAVTLESGNVAGLNKTGSVSVSGWYRLDVRADATPHNIFSWFFKDGGGSSVGSLHLWSSTNQFTLQLQGVATLTLNCPFVIAVGTWYFFHAFYDVSTGKITLEINLASQGTSASGTTVNASVTANFALLSVLTGAGNDFRVDEIAVRDYLPNFSELLAFYNNGNGSSWPLP